MDESRLRVGSKIKIISDPDSCFCGIGDVGYLVANTKYHNNEEAKDRSGSYWADFGHPEYKKICFGWPGYPPCFKVLKY